MLKISYRTILAFFLLEFAMLFVGSLTLVDSVKSEDVKQPVEIIKIVYTPSESQIEPIPEETIEKEPFCYISDDERYTIACIIAGESYNYSPELKAAVAQTIYTAMQMQNCRVDDIKSRYDGYRDRSVVEDHVWDECLAAIERVFDNGDMIVEESIEFFYNPYYCSSKWHEDLTYVTTIDGCRFFMR